MSCHTIAIRSAGDIDAIRSSWRGSGMPRRTRVGADLRRWRRFSASVIGEVTLHFTMRRQSRLARYMRVTLAKYSFCTMLSQSAQFAPRFKVTTVAPQPPRSDVASSKLSTSPLFPSTWRTRSF